MTIHLRFILFTFFFSLSLSFFAQTSQESDKTLDAVKKLRETYNYKGNIYEKENDYDTALSYYSKALQLNFQLKDKQAIAGSHYSLGICYYSIGKYEVALQNFRKSNELNNEIGNKKGLALTYIEIGNVFWDQGNFDDALDNYLKGSALYESLGDMEGIANAYFNIGYVHLYQGDNKKALDFFSRELEIADQANSKNEIANAYNGLGDVFEKTGNYEEAVKSHTKSLKLRQEIKDSSGIARSYGNIGIAYTRQGEFTKALPNYIKLLKISESIDDKLGSADAHLGIGEVYLNQDMLEEALINLNQALVIYKELENTEGIQDTYFSLSMLHEKTGNYKEAYESYNLYSDTKDSLFNERSNKQIKEMSTKYESEKKEKDIDLLTKETALRKTEIHKQKTIRNNILIGLTIAIVLTLLIYNRNSTKQKLNTALSLKNDELTQKNILIERQQTRILDSINYAQRIQQSILIDEKEIKTYLPDSFVFYRPKDIISGDFYWFSHINNKLIIAAVDCTGHGVPGAFMSMIGNTLLNQIVNEQHITTPSEILSMLNIEVFGALRQEKDSALERDSMDIALCCIDLQNKTLEYAGARNPLYIIKSNELKIINADHQTIGSGGLISKKTNPADTRFTNHTISIEKDTCIYLFTDGYKHQFGGNEKKKFGTKRFKEMLQNINQLEMQEQKEILLRTLAQWQADIQQIDDMLVIGIKFTG